MPTDLDLQLVRAKWTLGYFPSENLPAFAADALEAGFDGPSLRRVAGFLKPNHWELVPHLDKMWLEINVPPMSKEEALQEIVKEKARQIVSSPEQALSIAKGMWMLFYDNDYDKIFWPFLEAEEYRPTFYSDEEAEQQLVNISNAILSGSPIPPGKSDLAKNRRIDFAKSRNPLKRRYYRFRSLYYRVKVGLRRKLQEWRHWR